jgi:hypothetical protein
MKQLARRVKHIEEKRGVEGPLVIMRMTFDGFTPEEEALFQADDERRIREAQERGNNSGMVTVLFLQWERERLAELRNASNSL